MIGSLIAAGSSLLGGFLNRDAAKDANAAQLEQARRNEALQREFAQNGIRWKVEDAKAAGVHPLYALGAQTASYSPVSVGTTADTSLGSSFASAGQDIGRAINATRTTQERDAAFTRSTQALTVQKMGLENELLASQIARMKVNNNPPIPSIGPLPPVGEANKQEDRPPLQIGGQRILTDPRTSNMEEFEKRYGDEGPASWIVPWTIGWNDLKQNLQGMSLRDMLWKIDRATRIW